MLKLPEALRKWTFILHCKNHSSRGLGCKRPQTGEALQSKMKDLSRKMPVLGIPGTPIRHRILKNQRFLKVGTQKREDLPRGSSRQYAAFGSLPAPLSAGLVQPWCDRNVHDPTTLRDVSVLPQISLLQMCCPCAHMQHCLQK